MTSEFPDFNDNLPDDGTFIPGVMASVETHQRAQETLEDITGAIIEKDKMRAHIGALQNRFENTATNLFVQVENLQVAESRLSDADIALEMTIFIRNQILSNSAVPIYGQANTWPQMLRKLIN